MFCKTLRIIKRYKQHYLSFIVSFLKVTVLYFITQVYLELFYMQCIINFICLIRLALTYWFSYTAWWLFLKACRYSCTFFSSLFQAFIVRPISLTWRCDQMNEKSSNTPSPPPLLPLTLKTLIFSRIGLRRCLFLLSLMVLCVLQHI